MKLTIVIGKNDIKRGEHCDAENCPIALATNRALAKAGIRAVASITNYEADFHGFTPKGRLSKKNLGSVDLPKVASDFIHAFDEFDELGEAVTGKIVQPFRFSIELPAKVAALAAKENN